MPGTSTTVAFPLNVAVRPVTLRLPLVTGPSTVITFKPLKPPVSGPAMLHTKIPPSAVTAKPKSDGESIVLPRRGSQISPPPTSCADDPADGPVPASRSRPAKAATCHNLIGRPLVSAGLTHLGLAHKNCATSRSPRAR